MTPMWRIVLLLVANLSLNCAKEIRHQFYEANIEKYCCSVGNREGDNTAVECDQITSFSFTQIHANYTQICVKSMSKCCEEKRSELCSAGINDGREKKNCKHRGGIWNLCCESCKSGINRAADGTTCKSPHLNQLKIVSKAFEKCCSDESQSRLLTSAEEKAVEYSGESYEDLNEIEDENDYDDREPLEAPEEMRAPSLTRKYSEADYDYLKKLYPDHKIFIEANSDGTKELKVACKLNHGCEHDCEMINGKQTCTCPEDHVLASDDKSCCKSMYEERKRKDEETSRPRKKCSDGYFLNDFDVCEDLDECKIDNNACKGNGQDCENFKGGFRCLPKNVCRKGYKFIEETKTCSDVDECSDNSHNCRCDEICINTVGSFKCKAICQQEDPFCPHDNRHSTPRSTTSTFIPPWTTPRRIPETTTERKSKPRSCENSASGSGEDCKPSIECTYDSNCQEGFECRDEVCIEKECPNGFELVNGSCTDIDECKNSSRCPITHKCHNNEGSYECVEKECESGYSLDSDGDCQDLDECDLHTDKCQENSKCVNTDGSYDCECLPGYVKSDHDDTLCEDLDECQGDDHLCEHNCHNIDGSYTCSCRSGYELAYNDRNCNDVDECASDPCQITEICIDEEGSFRCELKTCEFGYELNYDDGQCDDVDECLLKNTCLNGICHNQIGSYTCECRIGYEPSDDDEHKCIDMNECTDGSSGCSHNCTNIPGGYTCSCPNGFILSSDEHTCKDEDECYTKNPCERSEICENTHGSYKCIPKICPTGFELDYDYECSDINECHRLHYPCLNGTCHNTPGSYYCTCNEGLRMNSDGRCVDQNECLDSETCHHRCENLFGSYKCYCHKGYKLNSDGKTCLDINECEEGLHNCNSNQECQNIPGKFKCINKCEKKPKCPPQNITITTTTTTQNPCVVTTSLPPCRIDDCQVDHDCEYGERCAKRQNGNYCIRHKCRRGLRPDFEKRRCKDINECAEGTHNCNFHELCINTKGSFSCRPQYFESRAVPPCTILPEGKFTTTTANPCLVTSTRRPTVICPPGYKRSKRGVCDELDHCHSNPCPTDEKCISHSDTFVCSKILCPTGMKIEEGTCVDVNECETVKCIGKCVNKLGGYSCECAKGFKRNNTFCEDLNECTDPKICKHFGDDAECINTLGSFECVVRKCDKDYRFIPTAKSCHLKSTWGHCKPSNSSCPPSVFTEVFTTLLTNSSNHNIFTLRGKNSFNLEIVNLTASGDDVKEAEESDFSVISSDGSSQLVAVNSLEGPQEVQLDLLQTAYGQLNTHEIFFKRLFRIKIFVSKFSSNRYVNIVEEDGKLRYF